MADEAERARKERRETGPGEAGRDESDTTSDLSDAEVDRAREITREEKGGPEDEEYHGDSRSESGTAPASAGEIVGSEGTIDPGGGSDIRPAVGEGEGGPAPASGSREAPEGTGETPVRTPSGGADTGQEVRTGSSAAASLDAGSGAPARRPEVEAMEEEEEEEEDGT